MGRKSNLRKKFAKLKLRQESEDDQKLAVQVSPSMENNAARRSEESEDDRLTCLPEKIMSNILSRLVTSEAVRTCVLSKSWVNKWTSITKLNCFDGFPFPKLHFLDGLESVIPKVSCLKQFTIDCFHMHDPSRLKSLIFSALKYYPLETLTVSMILAPCSFSLGSFTKNSLTKLDLSGNITLTFPADVSFSHLKSLRLFCVTLQNFHQSFSGKVIMRMPVLEDFKLIHCKLWNVDNLEIVAPLLSKLGVVRCTYFDLTGVFTRARCAVEISGGSNIDFTYVGSFSEEFVVRSPSNVAIANLKFFLTTVCDCLQYPEEVASSARLLLEKFHTSLKTLELSQDVFMVLANIGSSHPIPVFENLKYAKIHMIWGYNYPDMINIVAVEVLMNAPFLEMLTISATVKCKKCKKGKRRVSKQNCGNLGAYQVLPVGNFMVNLKRVKFESFDRWVEEVELVGIFLAHAPVLEEVSIPVTCLAVAKKLEKQFSTFPKASGANASLVFRFHD